MEAWQKWSFAFSPASPGSGGPPGWTPVHKSGASASSHRSAGRW
jgi:hypothetical protein